MILGIGPGQITPELPNLGNQLMKLKGPQVVVNELFIYTLNGCSCFTASMIKINKINYVKALLSFEVIM